MDVLDPTALVLGYIAELRGISEDTWCEGTVVDLGHRLHRLRVLQGVLRQAEHAIEDTLVASMETEEADVPGLGRLLRVERFQSTWRDGGAGERMRDDLARAVATTVAIDVATGDIDSAKRNIAMHTMRTAYQVIPSFSTLLKVGRERLGLVLDDYRSYSSHYTVTVEALEDEG